MRANLRGRSFFGWRSACGWSLRTLIPSASANTSESQPRYRVTRGGCRIKSTTSFGQRKSVWRRLMMRRCRRQHDARARFLKRSSRCTIKCDAAGLRPSFTVHMRARYGEAAAARAAKSRRPPTLVRSFSSTRSTLLTFAPIPEGKRASKRCKKRMAEAWKVACHRCSAGSSRGSRRAPLDARIVVAVTASAQRSSAKREYN